MSTDIQHLRDEWQNIQDEYAEAEKDVREANKRLEEVREWRDGHIKYILFGII